MRRMPRRDNQTDSSHRGSQLNVPKETGTFSRKMDPAVFFVCKICRCGVYNAFFCKNCVVWKGKVSGMSTKFVFVTGGVVSGLGKGICAASLGRKA